MSYLFDNWEFVAWEEWGMAADPLEKEFEAIFQVFVEEGGLDRLLCVDEDVDRAIRRHYCVHNIPKARCSKCRTPPPNPYYTPDQQK